MDYGRHIIFMLTHVYLHRLKISAIVFSISRLWTRILVPNNSNTTLGHNPFCMLSIKKSFYYLSNHKQNSIYVRQFTRDNNIKLSLMHFGFLWKTYMTWLNTPLMWYREWYISRNQLSNPSSTFHCQLFHVTYINVLVIPDNMFSRIYF